MSAHTLATLTLAATLAGCGTTGLPGIGADPLVQLMQLQQEMQQQIQQQPAPTPAELREQFCSMPYMDAMSMFAGSREALEEVCLGKAEAP